MADRKPDLRDLMESDINLISDRKIRNALTYMSNKIKRVWEYQNDQQTENQEILDEIYPLVKDLSGIESELNWLNNRIADFTSGNYTPTLTTMRTGEVYAVGKFRYMKMGDIVKVGGRFMWNNQGGSTTRFITIASSLPGFLVAPVNNWAESTSRTKVSGTISLVGGGYTYKEEIMGRIGNKEILFDIELATEIADISVLFEMSFERDN